MAYRTFREVVGNESGTPLVYIAQRCHANGLALVGPVGIVPRPSRHVAPKLGVNLGQCREHLFGKRFVHIGLPYVWEGHLFVVWFSDSGSRQAGSR